MSTYVIKTEQGEQRELSLREISREVTEADERVYWHLVRTELTPEERERITTPPMVHDRQRSVLAVHWHPEHVPLDLVRTRIERTFPAMEDRHLLIPTQHNEILVFGDWAGVEVDCYSPSFHRKVQLLFHFHRERVEGHGADVFRAMCEHTRRYRSRQLFEYMDSITEPQYDERARLAAERTGANEDLVEFVRIHVRRLQELIEEHESDTPPSMVKNKLVRNYFDAQRVCYGDRLIHHVQHFVREVKQIVKQHFSLDYFYTEQEFIDEVRGLGGCIVIPHPEQFWPILLEELDVDGIEVWNPQSFQYTSFLIDVVNRTNKARRRADRPILVTMGDDCHLGEKLKNPRHQDPAKASREIGVQPPWEDLTIRKRLIAANASRQHVIEEYKARLA